MSRPRLYTTTALSLGFAGLTGSAMAQSVDVSADELAQFSPEMQQCIMTDLDSQACAGLRDVISRCAEDIARDDCVLLLDDDAAMVVDATMLGRAQEILQQIDATLPVASDTAEPEPVEEPAPEESVVEEPETLDDSAPEAEAAEDGSAVDDLAGALEELFTDPAEEEAAEEPAPVEEPELAEDPAPEAEPEPELADDPAPEAEVEPELAEDPAPIEDPAPLEDTTEAPAAEPEAAPEAQAEADAQEDDDMGVLGQMLERLQGTEEPQTEDAEAAEAEADQIEAEIEAERERLLAEADAMAEEAPELIVEDIPEEEVVAPVEAPRELDATQQAAIEQMMESPDVSSAVGVLGAMLGMTATQPTEDSEAPAEERRTMAERREEAEEAETADAPAEAGDVTEETITRDQVRSSRDDFVSRLALDFDADSQARESRSNRRDLERAGLVALSALAVGMVINQNRVVARSDERVVVDRGAGDLELWRDDDSILLQDGSTRRIERFDDGSTRTRWMRQDGTETVTIRDATGRVLLRERVLADGEIVVLVDDTRTAEVIDVSVLPPPRTRELRITPRTDPDLALALLQEAEADARALDRRFSLRQVRDERVVRELVPLLSPDPITFETNRANVRPDEASKLLQVGRLMERLLAADPRELFLIEGHTDATGPAAFNLALSDRRAESVALALTEFFDIPPENLVVQGYGKRYLRIQTLASEERNRRVAIRRITPLLQ